MNPADQTRTAHGLSEAGLKIQHNHGLFKKIDPLIARIAGLAGQSMDLSPFTYPYLGNR